jgi:hypothetical protein
MRQNNNITVALAACCFAFLSLSGCLDITTTSKVNSDGSIVRTMTFSGDSAEVYAGKFPVELDSSWSRSIARVENKAKDYTLTASRTFRDVEELDRAVKGTFGKSLQFQIELKKSFRWFFTVYRYSETMLSYAQFTSIPMSEFLSQGEQDWLSTVMLQGDEEKRFTTRGDSLAFESIVPRAQEWEWRNRFEGVFSAFLGGVRILNNPALPMAEVEGLKDSLYKKSAKAIDEQKIDTLRFIFKSVIKAPFVDEAWKANEKGIDEVKRKLEFERETNSHKYTTNAVMPGLITGSNAGKIEGNTATWEDYKETAHHFGYTMWVESRQVNWWAVIVALVIVVSLMAGLVLSVVRRRNRL